ncbi:3-keto-5-aminohexanoate cleavage protein [Rhodococcus sp. Eu-32]|uniref:3-keto-5-aminohexanoate cleavage protein n=1 Tax=Rhodococcus sp. Eu-32 TaxID=1017319 RepID=UPI000DF29AFE|nr:3-keto-5-aminohexanoate cleavage protein [Rhodococcus sp. Eu-32]RRQ29090.1 3-keto-5-aminohexanoate cleavage protein [Rhodococcus sp. Eu-32]
MTSETRTSNKPVVIGVHVNEGTMRDPNPRIPWTPTEIGDTARECEDAGASLIHFHGRTSDGGADHSSDTYGAIIERIRATTDLLLAPSLANVPGYTVEQRLSNLVPNLENASRRPDFLVIDMGCAAMDLVDPDTGRYVTDTRTFVNDTRTQTELLDRAEELELTPYMASFNVSWTRAIVNHARSRSLTFPLVVAFILGGDEFPAAHPASAAGLRAQLDLLPPDLQVEPIVSAYRGNVLEAAEESIRRGGHVAIGAGDHHYAELGCPSTADLVRHVVEIARRHGRAPATPEQARRILGVKAHAGNRQ